MNNKNMCLKSSRSRCVDFFLHLFIFFAQLVKHFANSPVSSTPEFCCLLQDGAIEASAAHEMAEELSALAPDEGRLLTRIFEVVTWLRFHMQVTCLSLFRMKIYIIYIRQKLRK